MSSLVELQYNPYIPQLGILIDGKQPPDFSRLIQYSDEDIWYWANRIMDTIYSEIRDEFVVSFTGTPQDAEIIQFLCEKCQFCVGFRSNNFEISESLQKRMGKLNQLIKKTGTTAYEKTVIDAMFFITPALQQYIDDIYSIDINNLFCVTRVQMLGNKSLVENTKSSILFILAEDIKTGCGYLEKLETNKLAYVLVLGEDNKILDITNSGWFIETTQDTIFNTIFDCFIQMPLVIAFRKCMQSIRGGNKITRELKLISCIEPLINVSVGKEVEKGKSIKVSISSEPIVEAAPKLIYKVRNQNIASCDGINVYGLQEGTCVLEVYNTGSKTPFYSREIRVFKRNRISKLVLSEDTLLMGLHDKKKITCDYFPIDADNINTISWHSSDTNIIRVNSDGCITAVGVGDCRIICNAENVSAQCICSVKPYAEDLKLNIEFEEDGILYMKSLQELSVDIECIPRNCIDNKVVMSSSDSDIVNVVNNRLFAKTKEEQQLQYEILQLE